jgi:predicted PurR-regulated permease PerM
MSEKENQQTTLQNVIDIGLKLGVLFVIIAWCFQIIKPFIYVFIWGIIIAVTILPLYVKLKNTLGNRSKPAAAIVTILLMAVFILPAFFLADSMIEGIKQYGTELSSGNISIPPPPTEVNDWPVIGKSLYSTWKAASESLVPFAQKYQEQLINIGQWLANALLGTGMGILQLIVSVVISGILLASSETAASMTQSLFTKFAGERGKEFTAVTEATIRNISKGVLGVAAIQSLFLGLILFISGVPYAGLWAIICLILAVIQIGPFLVTIPVIIYYYVTLEPGLATLWTVFLVLGTLLDNFLKPILMGKDAPVPTLVIFLGAIGGFISSGFIGLFIGAIALSLGYKLLITWLKE